jgi:predicted TIM-barrel fold metal-dependent hydrolase
MKPFIFSADGHIREPHDLFTSGLPVSLREQALRTERKDGYVYTMSGSRMIHRIMLEGQGDIGRNKRQGGADFALRLEDMALDGIDAEIIFPTVALNLYFLTDPELELASAQIYNDWLSAAVADRRAIFVPCAILPVQQLANTLSELKRAHDLKYTAAMLPVVTPEQVPKYNDPAWDPIFAAAARFGITLVFHTGTGLQALIAERGPGGAVVNYSRQMNDGINTVMMLTSGGVLDRNPSAQIAIIESGASWLSALAERMDEVYHAHQFYVKPKLSVLPSEIIRRQVKCSFQHDRACIMARQVTGHESLMWASDYPHAEGTFPESRNVVAHLFDGIDISEPEKADILGNTAAQLFKLPRPAA